MSRSVQIWNTFGLSQPSFSAECEKMNFSGVSNDSSRSLSFMMSPYARSAFSRLPALRSLVSVQPPFLSIEK
ncbi:Uncharacterised protein [Burkholderia pseudomallei]|nr:Uncharacterised protein [Burkholderia pseudomallei]